MGLGKARDFRATLIKGNVKRFKLAANGKAKTVIAARHPSLAGVALPPPVSAREMYGKRPSKWAHKVSPDGNRLAWHEIVGRRPTLHYRNLPNGKPVRLSHPMPVTRFQWARDSRKILFTWNLGSRRSNHLFSLDTNNPKKQPRDLTPFEGVQVRGLHILRQDPKHVMLKMNRRRATVHDLYKLNLDSGEHILVEKNRGDILNWVSDQSGVPIIRLRQTKTGVNLETNVVGDSSFAKFAKWVRGEKWNRLIEYDRDDRVGPFPPIKGASHIFMLSGLDRDKRSFQRLDLVSGKIIDVYAHPRVDVDRVWFDYEKYAPKWAVSWDGHQKRHAFDPKLDAIGAAFAGDGPVNLRRLSNSRDGKYMTLGVSSDRLSPQIYLFNTVSGKKQLLTESPQAWLKNRLSKSRPLTITARDGLALDAYLTIPQGTNGRNLPMVMKVHGGPWARDTWGFDRDTQYLANRGYAVLRVNYRGSEGFGRKFKNAGRREFAGKMHSDLIDAARWAIAEKVADPKNIAIYGVSYGGYATLVGLTKTPDFFAAGIDVVGPSDLVLQVETFPPHMRRARRNWIEFVGNPNNPNDRRDIDSRSPINLIDKITKPLMVVHGAKDVRVSKENSDRLVAAMRAKGLPVEYIIFANEGHGIRRTKNRIVFAKRMEKFLARHLGGRSLTR